MAMNFGGPDRPTLAKLVLASERNRVDTSLAAMGSQAGHCLTCLTTRRRRMFGKLRMTLAVALLATVATAFAEDREQKKGRTFQASETIGLTVVNRQDEELGKINDLVVSPAGARVTHIFISSGGVLGLGETLRPVPIEAARFLRRGEDQEWAVQLDVERERFEVAPAIEQDDWTTLTQTRWSADLDTFYAVEDTERRRAEHIYKVSDLTGMEIRDRQGKEAVGTLAEIVFESNTGKIRYGALSFGGFLGFGENLFAVPWQSIAFTRPAGQEEVQYLALRVEVSEGSLREAQGFSKDKWPATADQRFLAEREGVRR
jgi:sporulation protein YlmC with PRC-barrel domain